MASEAKNNPHGMDRQIWENIKKKFDPTRAVAALNWISEVTGEALPEQGSRTTLDWFAETVKDGYFLTKLMLTLDPTCKKKVKKAKKWKAKHEKLAFKQMEQIEIFGAVCVHLGLLQIDVVTTQDVYNMENPNATVCCLYSLNAQIQKNGWNGALIAGSFAHATKNNRNFSAEVLKKGQTTLSTWEKGSIEHDVGNKLDAAGVCHTAGSEGHKISTTLGTWESGSIQHEGEELLDQIVKVPKANKNWAVSSEIPATSKGSIAHENNSMDGYGVIRGGQN